MVYCYIHFTIKMHFNLLIRWSCTSSQFASAFTRMPTLNFLPLPQNVLAMRSSCKAARSERRAVLGRHAGRLQLDELGPPQCLHAKPPQGITSSCIGSMHCKTGNKQSTEDGQERCEMLQCPAVFLYLREDSMLSPKGSRCCLHYC